MRTFDPLQIADHCKKVDHVLDEVRRLVAKYAGTRKVLPESRLWHDLRIDPRDAWELLECIIDKFGTSFEAMSFLDYFPDQPEAFGARVGMALGFRSHKKPITVLHLAQTVERGEWFEPPAT